MAQGAQGLIPLGSKWHSHTSGILLCKAPRPQSADPLKASVKSWTDGEKQLRTERSDSMKVSGLSKLVAPRNYEALILEPFIPHPIYPCKSFKVPKRPKLRDASAPCPEPRPSHSGDSEVLASPEQALFQDKDYLEGQGNNWFFITPPLWQIKRIMKWKLLYGI